MTLFKNLSKYFLIVLLLFIFASVPSFAKVGVGVGTGKIYVDEPLKPGTIYTLPVITVLNTGDDTTTYGTRIAYHQDQEELTPAKEWFSFSPSEMVIEPTKGSPTEVTLSVPIKAEPGDYFAYVEAYPMTTASEDGTTSISIAAATKLYFTVAPSNVFEGVYYKSLSLFNKYRPWTTIAVAVFAVLLILNFLRKRINISFHKKSK